MSRSSRPRSTISSLAVAIAHKDDRIVDKFLELYDLPFEEAEDLFVETKKWLWLFAKSQEDAANGRVAPTLFVDGPLLLLDEMWHTFILFTREYTDYCEKHFGRYIHHAPATRDEQERAMKDLLERPGPARREAETRMRAQYEYVFENLGEGTVRKWYSEYAAKHTPAFVKGLRR